VPVHRRALVVDDSARVRASLAGLLTRAGWQVVAVAGADAALRAAVRRPPDLVVTAARMRSGDGVALLRRLRRQGSRADVVVLAARPDARVHAAVTALGGTCLSSPLDPRQLVGLLRGRTTAPAARDTAAPLRVTAERLDGTRGAPSSAPSSGYRPAGARRQDAGWAARLPLHLAQMAASAR
jgi:DNA-binding response OmpR family regulator